MCKKITKVVATRGQILKLKCTQFDFGVAPPQTLMGSSQHSPDPWLDLRDPTSKRGKGKRRMVKGKETDAPSLCSNS